MSMTPQGRKLRFPMGYFYYIFCGLARRSEDGEVDHQDLIESLKSYEWKYDWSEDIIGDALRQGLIEQVRDGIYIRTKLQWEDLQKANLFKEIQS
jgi:hypothetical protein